MESISLTKVIEKMKLENLTPEVEVKGIRLTQSDLHRPGLQIAGFLSILTPRACRLSELWSVLTWRAWRSRESARCTTS